MRAIVGATLMPALLLIAGNSFAGEHVPLDKLPAAVRATVQRETKGGKIKDIEKDTEEGVLVYEVEFTLDGKDWEIDVATDGKLLDRHPD